MINLSARLYEVKQMIDDGQYFSINRARQYGKTTLIHGLVDFLRNDYEVLSLDFQTLSLRTLKVSHILLPPFPESFWKPPIIFPILSEKIWKDFLRSPIRQSPCPFYLKR